MSEDKSNLVQNEETEDDKAEKAGQPPSVTSDESDKSDIGKNPSKSSKWKMEGLNIVILCVVIFSVGVTTALVIHIFVGMPQVIPHASVISDDAYCSNSGLDVISKGGNAVDAAVATALCLTVVRPDVASLGGCGTLLIHDHAKSESTILIDGLCRSPMGWKEGPSGVPQFGGASVGVPGLVKALHLGHGKWGQMKWNKLVEPAMKVATEGFKMSAGLYATARLPGSNLKHLPANLNTLYSQPVGNQVTPPASLKTLLTSLASDDWDALTKEMLTVKAEGSTMTQFDLTNYTAINRTAIKGLFAQHKLVTFPAPSWAGPALLMALHVLEATPLSTSQPELMVRFIEAMKWAQATASAIGDPDAADSKTPALVKKMLSASFAESTNKKINDSLTFPDSYYQPFVSLSPSDDSGGTQILVVDSGSLYVSLTLTLNSPFGSGVSTQAGVILNNALSSFAPSGTTGTDNVGGPGKRPASSMVPVLVVNPKKKCGARFVSAANHGRFAWTGIAQVIINALQVKCSELDCLDLEDPTTNKRLHTNLGTGTPATKGFSTVLVEKGYPPAVVDYLKKALHPIVEVEQLQVVDSLGKVLHKMRTQADPRSKVEAAEF